MTGPPIGSHSHPESRSGGGVLRVDFYQARCLSPPSGCSSVSAASSPSPWFLKVGARGLGLHLFSFTPQPPAFNTAYTRWSPTNVSRLQPPASDRPPDIPTRPRGLLSWASHLVLHQPLPNPSGHPWLPSFPHTPCVVPG